MSSATAMIKLAKAIAAEIDSDTLRAIDDALTLHIVTLERSAYKPERAREDANRLRSVRHLFGHARDIQRG